MREVGQGRAFCARRASGRSEAESLDEPPALRTIVLGKMERCLPSHLLRSKQLLPEDLKCGHSGFGGFNSAARNQSI